MSNRYYISNQSHHAIATTCYTVWHKKLIMFSILRYAVLMSAEHVSSSVCKITMIIQQHSALSLLINITFELIFLCVCCVPLLSKHSSIKLYLCEQKNKAITSYLYISILLSFWIVLRAWKCIVYLYPT